MPPKKTAVLLVDDEAPVHYAFGLFLREAGYLVAYAKDHSAGLRMFKENSWDLVITDRSKAAMRGEELEGEIRMIAPDIPLILITGLLKADARVELFDAVLEKPFSKADLLAATARVLQRTRRL